MGVSNSADGKRSGWTTSWDGTRFDAAITARTKCLLWRPAPSEGHIQGFDNDLAGFPDWAGRVGAALTFSSQPH